MGDTGVRVNLAHAGDLALFAVTTGRAVGVDIEELPDARAAQRLAARYFPLAENAHVGADPDRFARLWTRKEACLKAAGGRLTPGLHLPVLGERPGDAFRVLDLPAPPGFRAAVALTGTADFAVSVRRWWPDLPFDRSPDPETMVVPRCSTVP